MLGVCFVKRSRFIFLFLIAMNMVVLAVNTAITMHQGEEQLDTIYETCQTRITSIIEAAFSYGDMHEAVVQATIAGMDEQYIDTLSSAIAEREYVSIVATAKDGIVDYAYPREYEDIMIGLDVSEYTHGQLENAVELQGAIFCGPYELHAGESGFLCITPVYDEGELWGFSCVSLLETLVLEYLDAENLLSDYEYQIRSVINGTGGQVLSESTVFSVRRATTVDFEMPNGKWELSLYAKFNWDDSFRLLTFLGIGCLLSYVVLHFLDSTEKKNHHFKSIASEDPLTGAYNRFELGEYTKALDKSDDKYSVVYLDLNKFKEINDVYGHDAGDYILKVFVGRIRQVLKSTDAIFRMGGDEFMILLMDVDQMEVIDDIIKRVHGQFAHPISFEQNTFHISASVGCAIRGKDGQGLSDLTRCADERMYEYKKANRKKQLICS